MWGRSEGQRYVQISCVANYDKRNRRVVGIEVVAVEVIAVEVIAAVV